MMLRLYLQARAYSFQAGSLRKVLIANRGEIACRVIRTAKRLGVETVSVYSDADRHALHVALADEAYRLGPASANESYLNFSKILAAAKNTGADAIHPGYGFLSENAEFANECQNNGVIFIGPPASAIRDMGIKSTSKEIMIAAGVPVIPGYHDTGQSPSRLKKEAIAMGFPIMIKAVRGGGGKGMRIVRTEEEFNELLESAKREAFKSFGNDDMLLEKFLERPRHIEVQIFRDLHGNCVHLYERDCSIQRRHQKVIEEAPAPGLKEKDRLLLGEIAVCAANAVNYVGAGTVEFIMDKENKFYFMEMNTRLQVEHPVTEMITGIDLVEWQLQVAAGKALPLGQSDIKATGHSFEARVYAENPSNNFMPEAGNLSFLNFPCPSENCRVETGVCQGDDITVHYDPMIAKLVVWGNDRTSALMKLQQSLSECNIVGLPTNVEFLLDVSRNKEFLLANVHTDFIKENHDMLFSKKITHAEVCAAALAVILKSKKKHSSDPFSLSDGWLPNSTCEKTFVLGAKEKEYTIKLLCESDGSHRMDIDDLKYKVSGSLDKEDESKVHITVGDHSFTFRAVICEGSVHIFTRDNSFLLKLATPKFLSATSESFSDKEIVSLMPGVITKLMVNVGDTVKAGDVLVVMTAMKMEYMLKAKRDGKIENIFCKAGDSVPKNFELVKIAKN